MMIMLLAAVPYDFSMTLSLLLSQQMLSQLLLELITVCNLARAYACETLYIVLPDVNEGY